MNDSLLVGMLHGLADVDEQLQPLARTESRFVAEFGDRHAADQLHDEVRAARVRRSRIKHLGDVRMIHHRQRLPLGLEAGDHLLAVHARLDDLQRDTAADRLGLLGHIDEAHAPFADLLQELVGADEGAGALGSGLFDGECHRQGLAYSRKAGSLSWSFSNPSTSERKWALSPQRSAR